MTICDRCLKQTLGVIMSKFNKDEICLDCHDDEQLAPGYAVADAMELAACRGGNYNYPGVGLSAADAAFLSERRKLRGAK